MQQLALSPLKSCVMFFVVPSCFRRHFERSFLDRWLESQENCPLSKTPHSLMRVDNSNRDGFSLAFDSLLGAVELKEK